MTSWVVNMRNFGVLRLGEGDGGGVNQVKRKKVPII